MMIRMEKTRETERRREEGEKGESDRVEEEIQRAVSAPKLAEEPAGKGGSDGARGGAGRQRRTTRRGKSSQQRLRASSPSVRCRRSAAAVARRGGAR
ncbi:hypothetical protein Syun_003811 [Stephania yunnanensis]|uniref:Uncharacterized protein n=1 Tax=Stephania yunnanensis TaxID=152371 RepID=A0AAP0Q1Z0_9MAGN